MDCLVGAFESAEIMDMGSQSTASFIDLDGYCCMHIFFSCFVPCLVELDGILNDLQARFKRFSMAHLRHEGEV